MNDTSRRANNAMIGLAIGDASSWTALFHRSVLLPPWTRRIRREIDAASETTNVIVTPMPFSLNRSADLFNISPTDDTEWAAFSAHILLSIGGESYADAVKERWLNLAHSPDPVRGGVGTQAALHNLRNGILPPLSGRENPHYFDDGAMSRAVPIGIVCAGRPEAAMALAAIDASVTNSEDGVWAAQAMAVAVSLLCAGESIGDAVNAAKSCLPASSWIRRSVEEAMQLASSTVSIFSILPELHNSIVNREYSYGNAAPETLALALIIAQLHGHDFATAVTTSTSFAKSSEALPAMVGALAGAMAATDVASMSWLHAVDHLNGICLPACAGMKYHTLCEALSQAAGKKISL